MDKIALLKEKTQIFKALLQANLHDRDVQLWFDTLNPLFADIQAGRVVPPKYFEYGSVLGPEHPFYWQGSMYGRAYTDFMSAMEDWASQPGFAEAVAREAAGKPPFADE